MASMESRFYHILDSGKLARMPGPAEALAASKDGGFIWLDYCEPTHEDLAVLVDSLGLHPLAIEDCFDENQIPKIEDYPQHTFILFNAFTYFAKKLNIYEVDFFIGEKFLVTVSMLDAQGRPLFKGIERIIDLNYEGARQGPAFLAHSFMDWIVDQKFLTIEALEEELNELEDLILSDHSSFAPSELVRLRRELITLRKSLFHEREILIRVCRKDSLYIPEKAILLYRDVYDHLSKSFELTESFRDLVTSLMEMYLSLLNNQMNKAANQTNTSVRRLTIITTIFMPLTLLAGVGGMSEWSMMTGPENWKIAYPAFLAGMVVLGVLNYFLLKWLERRRLDKQGRDLD
jgi:magnesium transporter